MFNLKTTRLILRDLEESDWSDFHTFSTDPEVTRYNGFIKTEHEEETRQWLREAIHHNQQRPRLAYSLAVVRRSDERMIGWIGIGRPSAAKVEWGDLDFGYALNRRFWGQGYMSEALQGLLAFCFQALGADKIFGECAAANPASARVMEKAGLRFEAQWLDRDQQTEAVTETWRYRITVAQWKAL